MRNLQRYILLVWALICPALACGQGGVPASPIQFTGPTGRPLAGATVTVCTSAGTGFPCSPLASIFTNSALTVASVNPVTTDGNGNLPMIFAAPGVYILSVTGSGITSTLVTATVAGTGGGNVVLNANNAFTANNSFPATNRFNFFRYVDALNVAGWTGANVTAWTQSAITDCGATACVVIVNPNAGITPANVATLTLPDNVSLEYYVQGRLQIRSNPTTAPVGASCGISVILGPASFSPSNPAINNCMPFYGAVQNNSSQVTVWGFNTVTVATVAGGNLWGGEVDVAPLGTTAGAFGFDAVAAGPGAPPTYPAFRCLTATNTNPVGGWNNCLLVQGITGTAITFAAKDTGLQITQVVTGSGSPQTVTTNGNCTVAPFSQLYVGGQISVDSGGTQEDVTITNTACSGTATVTGIFTKSHVNPTNFTEYGSSRLWDAQNHITSSTAYIWGSIQKYNTSNSPNLLTFSVLDSGGVARVVDYFTANNVHAWRDVGTNGVRWESQAGVSIASLDDAGNYIARTLASNVATGTPPIVVSSTTPVPTLVVSNHPLMQACGTTTACSHTATVNGQMVSGNVALASGTPSTATITGIAPAFTSTSTFDCTASNYTTQANPIKVAKVSASSITLTGPNTVTDVVGYICTGN